MSKTKRFLLYFVLLANLAAVLWFWYAQSGAMLWQGWSPSFLSLGRITGLLAVFFILFQILLIGRVKWIERIFGMDKLSLLHHWVGVTVPVFIIAHPVFLALSYSVRRSSGFWPQLFKLLFTNEDLLPATIATILFLVVAVTSVIIVFSKKLKYEHWFFIHLTVYLAILWSFEHQLETGGDFRGILGNIFAGYWYALYFFTFANLIWYRFVKQLVFWQRHRFTVEEVVPENSSVWSVYISGKNLDKFEFSPGQFAILRFLNKKGWWQAHPFSFSCCPNGNNLRFTIKNLGDFSGQVGTLAKRTPVLLDGPHGVFVPQRTSNNKLLLIAGGVGIAPIRSLLEYFHSSRDVVLLYGNRNQKDIIFEKELNDFAGEEVKIFQVLSDEPTWNGEKGRIDEEKIRRLAPDYLERDIFLCGPPAMMMAARQTLLKMGVKKDKIYFEKFSLGS